MAYWSLGLRQWGTVRLLRLNCVCVCSHILIQYVWSTVAFGLNPTSDAPVPRHISWSLSCRVCCMAGKGMCVWGIADQATCVQVSVKLCLTCSGVLVCNHLIISDLRLQFCHNSSDICLCTRELPVSAIKVMCASGVGGSTKPSKGLKQRREYMLSLPEKAACQRFATQRRGQCIWPCCSCCCSRWPQADVAGPDFPQP